MLWGKLIDHDRCIGCHACSVACKAENDVPLGVFRTWVKQVEKGSGPATKRHFGVLRCNQCEDAPCVAICPTAAMHRRPDGIVDFDKDVCIGCKACIQACPYDAIYIDPSSHTAAKCNFCAHRVEVGLQPACVSACPTGALVVSDLDDPTSPVARAVAGGKVQVRKPELATRPKVFYKGADESVLDPRAATRTATGIWGASRGCGEELAERSGGTGAPAAARVAYDVPREGAPWGAKISAYLLAKSLGAGALLIGGLGLLAFERGPQLFGMWPPVFALAFLALTLLLLVADLRRPERFLLLLFRPQPKSWLVRGAFVLFAACAAAAAWLGALAYDGGVPPAAWRGLGAAAVLGGVGAAGYTAFLFGQARGRAFWQSPLLLPHLVIQAALAGTALLAIVPGMLLGDVGPGAREARLVGLGIAMAVALGLNLLMVLAELGAHGGADARLAVRWLTSGERATTLYLGVLVLGHVFPATCLVAALSLEGAGPAVALGGLGALSGLFLWDHLYVLAGQAPPLS